MIGKTYEFNEIANHYCYNIRKEDKDNMTVLTSALETFEQNGFTTVGQYKKMTGEMKNDYDMFEDDRLNKYFNNHFVEFEHFLAETCKTASRLISYKPDKKALQDIRMILVGFDEPEYSTYDGICVDLLNDVSDDYVQNGVLSEKREQRIHYNPYEQFCFLHEILVRLAKQIIKIMENHELPLLFRDFPYGIPKFDY